MISIVDIDIYKYFDKIPDGLFTVGEFNAEDAKYYAVEAMHKVIADVYTTHLMKHINGMTKDDYKYAEHHLKISEDIAKQFTENVKIELL